MLLFVLTEDIAGWEEISESVIQEILESTGKDGPEMQLNCSACGYETCRDNAIAVARGIGRSGNVRFLYEALAQQRATASIGNHQRHCDSG